MYARWFHGSRAAFWREPGDGGPGGKNQRAGHATHGSTLRRASGFVVSCWRRGLVSRHGSDVVGCAQPWERSEGRIAPPIPSVLASDATPRCASMASADRQMIGDATLAPTQFFRRVRGPCLVLVFG